MRGQINAYLFLLILLLVVVGVPWLIRSYLWRRRMGSVRTLAEQQGWEQVKDDTGLLGTLADLPYFSENRERAATTNVLRTETDGAKVTFFDYSYYVRGKNDGTRRMSVLRLESTRLDLPTFEMKPMDWMDRKLERLVPSHERDIDFEEQPEFSAAYLLQGPDEARIRTLFGAEQAAFFVAHHDWWVEGSGQRLILYSPGKVVHLHDLPSFLEEGRAVLRLLSREAPAPAGEPDALTGLDELLAEAGVDPLGSPPDRTPS